MAAPVASFSATPVWLPEAPLTLATPTLEQEEAEEELDTRRFDFAFVELERVKPMMKGCRYDDSLMRVHVAMHQVPEMYSLTQIHIVYFM